VHPMKRQRLNAVRSPTPHEILYHYTTQRGIIGIFETSELWLTHTQYLNDHREFRHALKVAGQNIVRQLGQESADSPRHKMLQEMWEDLQEGGQESINVCVGSFSERGDSLSQWRAYGGPDGGFAIGFDGATLRKIADDCGFLLAKCIYGKDEQNAIVSDLIDEVIEDHQQHSDDDRYRPGHLMLTDMNQFGPIMKDSHFAEEDEWRLISRPLASVNEQFAYRPGKSMLVPYFRLKLPTPLPIRKIVVGSTTYKTQARRAVQSFAARVHLPHNLPIINSKVPYRSR